MFTLPKLPYEYNALEPYIDEMTMKIHHTRHHQIYIEKLNTALESYPSFQETSLERLLSEAPNLPADVSQVIANNAGGHYNHSFFWEIMTPTAQAVVPTSGVFFDAIKNTFGSIEVFKNKFTEKAMSVFGSGWIFLIKTPDGRISLKRHSFQNSPVMHGNVPVLGLDLWEHAYYLKYQNRRDEYIKAWWNVVNWRKAESLYLAPGS